MNPAGEPALNDALAPADLRRLLDAIYVLGRVATISDLPHATVRLVHELVPCDRVGWVILDFASGQMSGIHWPVDLTHLFSELPRDLMQVPLVPAASSASSANVIRLSDFLTRRQLHSTAIYMDLYRASGIEYQVVIPLSFGAPGSSGLRGKRAESLTLARHDSDFTDRERSMLEEFGRHVRNAARRLRGTAAAIPAESAQLLGLTARQAESLVAIADGATVQMAARSLGVTAKTLENHLQAAYLRLGVSNRTAALARLRSVGASDYALGEIPY